MKSRNIWGRMNKQQLIKKLNKKERGIFKGNTIWIYMEVNRNMCFFIQRKGLVREFDKYLKSKLNYNDLLKEYRNIGKTKR